MYDYVRTGTNCVYPMLFITLGFLLLVSRIFEEVIIFKKPLEFISKYTYQFYLLQTTITDFAYKDCREFFHPIPIIGYDIYINVTCMLMAFMLSIILTYIVENVIMSIKM